MVRTLGGLVAGMLVALVLIMSIQALGHRLVPLPGLAETQPVSAADRPLGALLFILLAWLLGVVAGAYVAIRLSGVGWTAWVVAGAIILAVLFRFALLPHPAWFMAVALLLPLLAAWLVKRWIAP